MKILIVEDDFASRLLLQSLLKDYGECHIACDGREAVEAMQSSLESNAPYNLICLDIRMPEMDGQEALRRIRTLEEERGIWSTDGVKIIMTTVEHNMKNIKTAYHSLCDAYLAKPFDEKDMIDTLKQLGLIT